MIGEEGGVVRAVRRLEGSVGVVSVELGDDGGDRGDDDGSLVSCSSCERRSSLGVTVVEALLGFLKEPSFWRLLAPAWPEE